MPEMGAEPVDVKDFEESTVTDNIDDILEDTKTTIPGTITTLQTDATALIRKAQESGVNVWYVDLEATGAENGTTWTDAFVLPSQAHTAASEGDLIIVMSGIYDENTVPEGLVITKERLTFICLQNNLRQGVYIGNTNAGATGVITVSGMYTMMKDLSPAQSGITGLTVSGGYCRFDNVTISSCDTSLTVSGNNVDFVNCIFASYTVNAIHINGAVGTLFRNCLTAIGSGGSDVAIKIITGSTWTLFKDCTITTGQKGYEVDAGAVYTSFINSYVAGFTDANTDAGTGTNVVSMQDNSKITAGNSLQQDLADVHTDTKTIHDAAITTPVADSLADYQISHDKHFHTKERWLGISGDQSGNDWALDTLTPFVAISGNNGYGADASDEAKILGTDDTPIITGKELFDIHRILVLAASVATVYKLRIVYGTGTMADAITAGQTSELTFIRESAAGRGNMIEVKIPRLAADTQVWVQAWCATDNATIDFLVGVHEYDVPEVP